MAFLNNGIDITADWIQTSAFNPNVTTGYLESGTDIGFKYDECHECPPGQFAVCSGFPSTYQRNGSTAPGSFHEQCI